MRSSVQNYEGQQDPFVGFGLDPALPPPEWNGIDCKSTGLPGQSGRSPIFPFTPAPSKFSLEQWSLPYLRWQQCPPPEISLGTSTTTFGTSSSFLTHDFPPPPPSKPPQIAPKENPPTEIPSIRRGPGRPKKYESKTQVFRAMKKQSHNLSASQSRAKLNSVIDELWHLLPDCNRLRRCGGKRKKATRTEKIEEAIEYVRSLREELSGREGKQCGFIG